MLINIILILEKWMNLKGIIFVCGILGFLGSFLGLVKEVFIKVIR